MTNDKFVWNNDDFIEIEDTNENNKQDTGDLKNEIEEKQIDE
jgi:hypothetical protein